MVADPVFQATGKANFEYGKADYEDDSRIGN